MLDGIGSVSIFNAHNGLEQGLPRKVIRMGAETYVVTDRKLYRLDYDATGAAHLSALPVPEIVFHEALSDDGDLWIGGSVGLNKMNSAGEFTYRLPGDIRCLGFVPGIPSALFCADHNELKLLMPAPKGGWLPYNLNYMMDAAPISLVGDSRGQVWLSTMSGEIRCFDPLIPNAEGGLFLRENARYVPGRGLPADAKHPTLSLLGTRLFALTDTQVLVFESGRGFVPATEFAGWTAVAAIGMAASLRMDVPGQATAYWVAQRRELFGTSAPYAMLRIQGASDGRGGIQWEPLQLPGLDSIGNVTSLDLIGEEDGPPSLWIGGSGGLLRVKTGDFRLAGSPTEPQLRRVQIDGHNARELQIQKAARIGPGAAHIEFSFQSAKVTGLAAVFYQTQLEGIETVWSAPQRENTRDFTGLSPGSYVFRTRRVDRWGHTSPAVEYPFVILAPWYAGPFAYAGYAVCFLVVAGSVMRWRLRLLQRQTQRLDRLVAQRTRELELSNTAKSEFLENISHEIRNPLNGIIGLANMLPPERLAPEDRQVARALRESAQNLRRVSDDVLDFSKLEFGGADVVVAPLSLSRVLEGVLAIHRESARQQGNSLTLAIMPGADDQFIGDEAKIRTIIGNFVSNAVKYAPSQAVEIRADWEAGADGLTQVFIGVTDHGPGVPAEDQELIFQKFVRGASTRDSGVMGAGIGLAMCRTLARQMGGTVGVESEPGHATTFHLWLPLRQAYSEATPITHTTALRADSQVLIVDDEEYNRIVLAGAIKELGYRPVLVSEASKAVEAMQTHQVSLVFLDLELPGLRGDEIARLLRQLPGGDRTLIIAVTAQDSATARQRCRQAGMDGFLAKPFDVEQIRHLLAALRPHAVPNPGSISTTATEVTSEPEATVQARRMRAFKLYAQGAPLQAADAVRNFIKALRTELSAIQAALHDDNRKSLANSGHRLRALGAMVGAHQVNESSRHLEERAADLSREELEFLVNGIRHETETLAGELEASTASSPLQSGVAPNLDGLDR